ncbi:MAG: HAMP domain-containing protein [Flavobacterium sp.]|nr:MAG: HAMP domain-containing protein [Flavobacterium sp.]
MNHFFRRLPLHTKLILIGLIPFVFLSFLTYQIYNEKTEKLKIFDNYRQYLAESENINSLIDAMQEERKFSFDYAITKQNRQNLVLQRPKTDSIIAQLIKSKDPSLAGFTHYTKLGQLDSIREKVDAFATDPNGVMHYYSNTIFRVNTLNTIPPGNTAYLQPVYKNLVAQKILSEMITYIGIIRSNVYNVLNTKKYMVETLIGTMGAYDVYKSYELEFMAKASPEIKEKYNYVRRRTALRPTDDYIDHLFKTFAFDESFTAPEWWKVSDEGTNSLRKLQQEIWQNLNLEINNLYEKEKAAQNRTLILLFVALGLTVILVSYILFSINQSLRELRSAAGRIAEGDTGIRISAGADDVIGKLANSIKRIDSVNRDLAIAAAEIGKGNFNVDFHARSENDLLGNAIVKMKDELEQYSRKMEDLVAERTEELGRSNEDLQQFAHVASHDLKEPLRKIATFSSILSQEQHANLTEKGKTYLKKIELASQRMSHMIEGVLAYSTVSVNEPPFELVDLNLIMEGVRNDLELAIIQKEAVITYEPLPRVTGIPLLLSQLFTNLISNALKFIKQDVQPRIAITSAIVENPSANGLNMRQGKYAHIAISDNGIGFNPEYADRMFGVFFRLNSKDQFEGTGLGLALCRKIVHRHGGEIYAEGQEGEGATFHLLLPVN